VTDGSNKILLAMLVRMCNFAGGENFCGENVCGTFLRELYFGDWEKNAKIAKIRTRKYLVPHGIWYN